MATNSEPRQVDLSLPKARVLKGYTDSSNTPVPLLRGFDGNLVFEPWSGFEEWVDRARNDVRQLDESVKVEVEKSLRTARKQLEESEPCTTEAREQPEELFRDNKSKHRTQGAEETKDFESYTHAVSSATPSSRELAVKGAVSYQEYEREGMAVCDNVKRVHLREFSNCKSLSRVIEAVFTACEDMICGIKKQKLFLTCLKFSVKAITDMIIPSEDATLKWESVEPDFSFSKYFNLSEKLHRPYATFEFKGPCRLLYKWKNAYLRENEGNSGSVQHDEPTSAPATADLLAKFCNAAFSLYFDDTDYDKSDSEEGEEAHDDESMEKKYAPRPAQIYCAPIAQVLTQGLISASGCCMLYNYQQAIAFKVCGLDSADNEKVRVLVSREFRCDEQDGTLISMVALMLCGYDMCDNATKSEELRATLRTALSRIYQETVRRTTQSGKRTAEVQEGEGETNKKQRTTSNPNQTHASVKDYPDHNSETTLCSEGADTKSDSSQLNIAKGTQATNQGEEDIDENVIRKSGIVGRGFSGIIGLTEHRGEKLVIKSWNGEEESGLKELQHEIEVYQSLSDKKYNLQGQAMPFLKAVFNQTSSDALLVIEYVGSSMREDDSGALAIGEGTDLRIILPEEAKAIRKAAVESLRSIHSAGYIHGDVDLRNLRVQCKDGSEAIFKTSWRACWIDYGRASVSQATAYTKAVEIGICRSLFAEAELPKTLHTQNL